MIIQFNFLQICPILLLTLFCCQVESGRKNCRNPSSVRKLARGLSRYKLKDLPESFYLMDKLRNKVTIPPEYIKSVYVNLDNENTTCPTTLENKLNVCPGYMVMEYDEFRIPSMMLQVHCKCNGCLGSLDKVCVRLFYYTRVLRVTGCNKKGVYVYDYFWEKVSNGCVCIKNERQTMPRGWGRVQHCVQWVYHYLLCFVCLNELCFLNGYLNANVLMMSAILLSQNTLVNAINHITVHYPTVI